MNRDSKYNNESVFTMKLPSAVYISGEGMVVDWASSSSANEYRFWTMFSMTQKVINSSEQPTSQVLLLPK